MYPSDSPSRPSVSALRLSALASSMSASLHLINSPKVSIDDNDLNALLRGAYKRNAHGSKQSKPNQMSSSQFGDAEMGQAARRISTPDRPDRPRRSPLSIGAQKSSSIPQESSVMSSSIVMQRPKIPTMIDYKRTATKSTASLARDSSSSTLSSIDTELLNEVATLVNRMVFYVSINDSLEKNEGVQQELESFQKQCWEIERQKMDKRSEMEPQRKMGRKRTNSQGQPPLISPRANSRGKQKPEAQANSREPIVLDWDPLFSPTRTKFVGSFQPAPQSGLAQGAQNQEEAAGRSRGVQEQPAPAAAARGSSSLSDPLIQRLQEIHAQMNETIRKERKEQKRKGNFG